MDEMVTKHVAAISLPPPRRKTRVKEVRGVALPLPTALPHPPCTNYQATYSQGHITIRDSRQAEALWHNGYFGHGLEGGGGRRGWKKWRLVETDGLKSEKWFKGMCGAEGQRREFRDKGQEERKGGIEVEEEEMEEQKRKVEKVEELAEVNRTQEIIGKWERGEKHEDELMEEIEEDDEKKGGNEENNIMNWEEEDKTEEGKEKGSTTEQSENTEKKETEDMEKNETTRKKKDDRETDNSDETTDPARRQRQPSDKPGHSNNNFTNHHKEDSDMRDDDSDPEPWRTVLVLSADHEATQKHCDPCAYLTLLPEEALFLSYALGCLVLTYEDPPAAQIKHAGKRAVADEPDTHEMTIDEMWRVFIRDNPVFPIKYAAFHHYRTQGWVVKAGLKYGVDYVLYPVGPPFYHSQYAVRVHSLWADTLLLDLSLLGHELTWTTVATTERLANHINKTPVMCFVLRPRSITDMRLGLIECLKELKVQEVVLARWNPSSGNG